MYYVLGFAVLWCYGLGVIVATHGLLIDVNEHEHLGIFGWIFTPLMTALVPFFLALLFLAFEIRRLLRKH